MMAMLNGAAAPSTPFAPPFLRDGAVVVSHVANILVYLGPKLGLAPKGEARASLRPWAAADDHRFRRRGRTTPTTRFRPISITRTRRPRRRRGPRPSSNHRVPKFLGYFERVAGRQPGRSRRTRSDDDLTTVDLSLFQVWAGMAYAFPRAFADAAKTYPRSRRSPPRSRSGRTSPATSPPTAAFRSTAGDFPALSGARPGKEIPGSIPGTERRISGGGRISR